MAIRFCTDRLGACPSIGPAEYSGRLLLAGLLALALCGAPGRDPLRAAPEGEPPRLKESRRQEEEGRLDRVRREIEELKARLADAEASAGSILDSIEELDLRMALLSRESESLRDDVGRTADRERQARLEAHELEQRLGKTEADLRGYLRETYKIGPARYLRVVAAASAPAQIAAGYRSIEALSLSEARRIEDYRADRARLDVVLSDLETQQASLRALQAALHGKATDLREARSSKQSILAGLQKRQTLQKEMLGDLVQVEQEVRALLDRLARPDSSGPVPSLGFARFRGLLDWPARGRLAVPFGNMRHPRFSTIVPHPGIDIASAPGQEVRAVFDGRVVFSDWFKGYGQMVVIDHGDGYLSVYGHVDERLVSAGQDIKRDDPIARSGAGGSFEQPGLYFEIRHDGRPEDPAGWLRGAPGRVAERKPVVPRGARDSRRIP